jgi:hypothetical protein
MLDGKNFDKIHFAKVMRLGTSILFLVYAFLCLALVEAHSSPSGRVTDLLRCIEDSPKDSQLSGRHPGDNFAANERESRLTRETNFENMNFFDLVRLHGLAKVRDADRLEKSRTYFAIERARLGFELEGLTD